MKQNLFFASFWAVVGLLTVILLKILFAVAGVPMGLCIIAIAIIIVSTMVKKMVDNFPTKG